MSDAQGTGQRLDLEALHARFLLGDERALEQICSFLFAHGKRVVRARRPAADRFTVDDAVQEAVARYAHQPTRFDPGRAGLLTWIVFAAVRKVDDHYRRQEAQKRTEAKVGPAPRGEPTPAAPQGVAAVIRRTTASRRQRHFIVAWLKGRSGEDLARILGMTHLSLRNQAQVLRREKERWRLQLKRTCRALKGR